MVARRAASRPARGPGRLGYAAWMVPSARAGVLLAAVLAALASASPATAGADGLALRAPSLAGHERVVLGHRPRPTASRPAARHARADLPAFTARRQLEARARVRGLLREGERRLEALHLRAGAAPDDVARAASRWRTADDDDARRDRIDLDALERRTGWHLRPLTRALLAGRLERIHREHTARRARQLEALREHATPGAPRWAAEVPGPVGPR